ncbi:MAG: BACON domain-containing protein [Alistipes sp.]|nr:BACON domain-containing protein [Alistipes sp.]
MKRYFIYIIMVLATLVVGCTPYATDENPQVTEIGDIEVAFSVEGEEVSRLDLTSVSHNIKVDVALNNEGVYWNVVSSKEWCQIVEEEHRGSGSFTLIINANDSFDARETATVTFKAGEYEQDMLTVDHSGNVFVIEQVYTASTKSASSFTTKIKTRDAGEAWTAECDSWITVTKGAVSQDAEGFTVTEVTISWEENATASRYGEVRLVKDGSTKAEGWINIWQYGTELNYDGDGNLLLAAQDVAPLELRVPKQTIKDIAVPSWVTYTTVENSDNTVSYMLQFAGNPSDANHVRATELEISFLSGAASIKLPTIMQEYYAMEGLVSGPGLKIFAQTWNAGGDVSQWYVDGVPTLMGDIDLTEVEEWVSIGTAERPWTGVFNGNGKKIINLKSSQPLFGVCADATLKDIIFDATTIIERKGTYSGECIVAPLAAKINKTTVEKCTNNATIEIDAIASSSTTYVSGLIGIADAESYVFNCTNNGVINIKPSSSADNDSRFIVGGIVANNHGKVDMAFATGSVTSDATAPTSHVGGIVGINGATGSIVNSHNAGPVSHKAGSSASSSYVGGITGTAIGTITGNTNEGVITSGSTASNVYVGGVLGHWDDANAVVADNTVANASSVIAEGAALNTYAGGLAGYVGANVPAITLDLSNYGGTLAGSVTAGTATHANAKMSAGGIFGYTETNVTISNLVWEGKVTFYQKDAITAFYANFGGLVGWANTPITLSGIESNGEMVADYAKQAAINFGNGAGGGSIGGLVGRCEEGATISNCTTNKQTSWIVVNDKNQLTSTGSSKHFDIHMGGIAGRIVEGDSSITNCHNKGRVYNMHYNNQPWTTTYNTNSTGGILGSFGSIASPSGSITIENCTNAANINTHRGTIAGIVGFAANATIKGCEYKVGNIIETYLGNSVCAGIVGIAVDSNISDCVATNNMNGIYAGSIDARMGGIVAHLMGESTVTSCSYYGTITYRGLRTGTAQPEYFGGIVGFANSEDILVSKCRCGGQIGENVISENNLLTYIINYTPNGGAASEATVTECSYWDGK